MERITEERSLHPAVRSVWRIGGTVSALVLAALTLIPDLLWLDEARWYPFKPYVLPVTVFVLFSAPAVLLANRSYAAWRYAVREHDVMVSSGLFWRLTRSVPRSRIQHVDIQSGPIDRRLGLCHLSLYTAGSMSEVATIPGLTPEDAESIRELLLTPRHG
jgi:membrane protein YdbS with pleckstrin-like domain